MLGPRFAMTPSRLLLSSRQYQRLLSQGVYSTQRVQQHFPPPNTCTRHNSTLLPTSTRPSRPSSSSPNVDHIPVQDEDPDVFHPAAAGAIFSGIIVFAFGYMYYHFSGAKSLMKTASQTKSYFENTSRGHADDSNIPDADEALKYLRKTAVTYASCVPGAARWVNGTFDDLELVRTRHGQEVDDVVREAYKELRAVSRKGDPMDTAEEAWEVMQKHLRRIFDLAGDAKEQILDDHPGVKERVGGKLAQLRMIGDALGEDGRRQMDEMHGKLKETLRRPMTPQNEARIRGIVQEYLDKLTKMADEAWLVSMKQLKPYLEKDPTVKEVVEKSATDLKRGDFQELAGNIRKAVDSGDTADLQQYVQRVTGDAKQAGTERLNSLFMMVPNGDQMAYKLKKLQQVAEKQGKEAEKLLSDTIEEINKVLTKRSDQAQKLEEKAEKSSKGSWW